MDIHEFEQFRSSIDKLTRIGETLLNEAVDRRHDADILESLLRERECFLGGPHHCFSNLMLRFRGISALGRNQFFGKQLLNTLMFAFGAYIIGLGLLEGTI